MNHVTAEGALEQPDDDGSVLISGALQTRVGVDRGQVDLSPTAEVRAALRRFRLALDELRTARPLLAEIAELYFFFGRSSPAAIATILGMRTHEVKRNLQLARAWLSLRALGASKVRDTGTKQQHSNKRRCA